MKLARPSSPRAASRACQHRLPQCNRSPCHHKAHKDESRFKPTKQRREDSELMTPRMDAKMVDADTPGRYTSARLVFVGGCSTLRRCNIPHKTRSFTPLRHPIGPTSHPNSPNPRLLRLLSATWLQGESAPSTTKLRQRHSPDGRADAGWACKPPIYRAELLVHLRVPSGAGRRGLRRLAVCVRSAPEAMNSLK